MLILDLLKHVLKNNVYNFEDQVFTQLHDVTMGTKLGPGLATMYIGDLEESFIESCIYVKTRAVGEVYIRCVPCKGARLE